MKPVCLGVNIFWVWGFREQYLIRQGSELIYLVLKSVGIIKTQGSHKSLCWSCWKISEFESAAKNRHTVRQLVGCNSCLVTRSVQHSAFRLPCAHVPCCFSSAHRRPGWRWASTSLIPLFYLQPQHVHNPLFITINYHHNDKPDTSTWPYSRPLRMPELQEYANC